MILPLLLALGIAAVVVAAVAYLALKAARDDANARFGNNCVGDSVAPCPLHSMEPISEADANELFDDFVARSNDVPFDYPTDCCYSRAHEMCKMMQDRGIDCGKVWNYQNPGPPPGAPLVAATPNSPAGRVVWGYHVAPVANVQRSDGSVIPMVFDPSMFNGPVTVDEWKAAQSARDTITQFTDASPYYRDAGGGRAVFDNDHSKTQEQFAVHMIDRDSQDPAFVEDLARRRAQRVSGATP